MQLLMRVKWETTSQPVHTSLCHATHFPESDMLHVLTMISPSAWPCGGMFNYTLTAINTIVLAVLCKTELWASLWLSREVHSSYWQTQPVKAMPSATRPHRGLSNPCFQWEKTQVHEEEGSTENSGRHPRWWRLRTVMDTAQCTRSPVLIPPVRWFDQCRFSDWPEGLLFLCFWLSVWHPFPPPWMRVTWLQSHSIPSSQFTQPLYLYGQAQNHMQYFL